MKTKVAVVIPNWNGKEFIGECLHSLLGQTVPVDIIVVDNGSEDGSAAYIKKKFPKVTVLEFKNNAGFAGGVNRGIRYALEKGYGYVALFNNDAVATKDWLKNLLEAAQNHPEAGIITGKFMRDDKSTIDSTGDFYSSWGMPFPRGRNQKDTGQYDVGEWVFAGTGGASLYNKKLFDDIGLFDENFFAYYEDVDISFRAQLAGWKVWYEPSAVAYHKVSATSSKLGSFARLHSVKNFTYLYVKNMPGYLLWKYLPLFILQLMRMLVGSVRDGELPTYLRALLIAFLKSPKSLSKRRKIQRNKKVGTQTINKLLHHGRPPKIPLYNERSA